jgi:hypothetical protein
MNPKSKSPFVILDENIDGLKRLALDGNSGELAIRLQEMKPLQSSKVDAVKKAYEKIPDFSDSLADVMAKWPETDPNGGPLDWTALISPVGQMYQSIKGSPLGYRLHPGYHIRDMQSGAMVLDYTHALAENTVSDQHTLIHLNKFLNLYRKSTPEQLEQAVLVIRSVHRQLITSEDIVLAKGTNLTIEKANKMLLQAQIANLIETDKK